ncbi:MAG: hypothetical protein DRP12_02400 [Candidatus Aenigmatarchaeota archaeon]|nr:MAG: hypothetical protein DRP12_02400 [Candidatus Aenigmarchaeota archaeon]
MLTIIIGSKSFTLTDEEEKALLTDMVDIAEWVENLLRNKVRRVMDRVIEEHTEYNPRKLTHSHKKKIIANLSLKTAAEKMAELEAEMIKTTRGDATTK